MPCCRILPSTVLRGSRALGEMESDRRGKLWRRRSRRRTGERGVKRMEYPHGGRVGPEKIGSRFGLGRCGRGFELAKGGAVHCGDRTRVARAGGGGGVTVGVAGSDVWSWIIAVLSHSPASRTLRGSRALGEMESDRQGNKWWRRSTSPIRRGGREAYGVPGWAETLVLRRQGESLVSTPIGGGSN
jgi:hypothetical protein